MAALIPVLAVAVLWLLVGGLLAAVLWTLGMRYERTQARPVVMRLLEERELQRHLRACATTSYLVEVDAHAITAQKYDLLAKHVAGSVVRGARSDRPVRIDVTREVGHG